MTTEPAYLSQGATFSNDRKYRYELYREWGHSKFQRTALFVMLNPSTADETVLDPTVRRCLGYAMNWGCTRLEIANIFALRSTNPQALYTAHDPIGPENDTTIRKMAERADMIIAAWGSHGILQNRGIHVLDTILSDGHDVLCLKCNSNGTPAHPLYQKASITPIVLRRSVV